MYHIVYDHVLPTALVHTVATQIQHVGIDWHWKDDTLGKSTLFTNPNIVETPQFTHQLFPQPLEHLTPYSTQLFESTKQVIAHACTAHKLILRKVFRLKANLLPQHAEFMPDWYHPPHCDVNVSQNSEHEHSLWSLIYYPFTCDGPTRIFDTLLPHLDDSPECIAAIDSAECIDLIAPVQGRCLLFPSSVLHASSPPIVAPRRMVINCVFWADSHAE